MNPRDQQWLTELAREHATPFFVLFSRVPQARYFELADAFRNVAKTLQICYSVKTNPYPKLIDSLAKMESGFELVSGRELAQVAPLSGPKIFNSCAATPEELQSALDQGALIILDSLSQAELLSTLARTKPLNVGVRIRLDSHRFGFAPAEIPALLPQLQALGLTVTVLHAHPGTNCSLAHYRNFISKVAALVPDYPFLTGLDLGGGFPGKISMIERKEPLESFVQIIREQLGDFLATRTLYLESGRFLVEDSMLLVAKVIHTKRVDGMPFVILDAGINALPRISMSPFRFFALTQSGTEKAHFRLGGPLMFGSDEMGSLSAALARGDLLCVENCGAYCTELAWRLSRDAPAIVCIE